MRLGTIGDAVRHLRRHGELAATDRDLLAGVAAGDPPGVDAAFRQLVERHGPMVYGVCKRVLGNPADADDAFQATFLVLAKKAAAGGWHESVANWLYGVAYRTALRSRGRAARRKHHEAKTPPRPPAGPADDPAGFADLRAVVDEEIYRLPDVYRLPVLLCCLHDRTIDEAAAELGLPPTTVKTRLQRGRDRLRDRLSARGIGVGVGVLAAVVPNGTATAVPLALVNQTLTLAATGTPVGAVSALVSSEISAMFWNHVRSVAVACGAAVVFAVGGGIAFPPAPTAAAPVRRDPPVRELTAVPSAAVVKDGLEVVVRPASPLVVEHSNLGFEVTYRNRGAKPITLHDVGYEAINWRITRDGNKNHFWVIRSAEVSHPVKTAVLDADPPGAKTVWHGYDWNRIRGDRTEPEFLAPPPQMSPGRYTAVGTIRFTAPKESEGFWEGTITTAPVSFLVTDRPGFPPAAGDQRLRGLSVDVRPTKFAFGAGETPEFEFTYWNSGEEPDPDQVAGVAGRGDPFALHGVAAATVSWEIVPLGKPTGWSATTRPAAGTVARTHLLPDSSRKTTSALTQSVPLPGPFAPRAKGVDPRNSLPLGRYAAQATITFAAPPGQKGKPKIPFWTGEVTTRPVEFEVAETAIDGPKIVRVGPSDDKKTVTVEVGQVVRVELPNNQARAGWEGWGLSVPDGPNARRIVSNNGVLRTTGVHPILAPAADAADPAIGVYWFDYLATGPGETKLDLTHVSPGGPEVGARDATALLGRFAVTIAVAK